jgi:TfoX/Sxy family transcriptional regulator of competence genes
MELFRSLVPSDPDVTIRPMFGNLSAFVNGNMFSGAFGEDLFVRLPEEQEELLKEEEGAAAFAPMAGRPLKGYVTLPRGWGISDPEKAGDWIARSLGWARTLPRKDKKKKRKGGERGEGQEEGLGKRRKATDTINRGGGALIEMDGVVLPFSARR